MRFLFIFLIMFAVFPARAQSLDEYNNVKPGLLLDETAQPTEQVQSAQEPSVITMTIEDVARAYQQGKYALVAQNILPLADAGYHQAEEILGLMYKSGQGVEKNPEKAVQWLTRAAQAGRALAEHHLGVTYYSGEGVTANNATALMWLKLAILHYPDGPEKKRAQDDFNNLSSQTLRRDREAAADMVRDWLEKHGEMRLLSSE